MAQSLIALIAMAVLIAMSWRADARLHREARLPMQWLLDGSVIWTAPRRAALAFTPVLAACVLLLTVVLSVLMTPRPGQEWLEVPVILCVALLFVGVHALHLFLIGKSLRADK